MSVELRFGWIAFLAYASVNLMQLYLELFVSKIGLIEAVLQLAVVFGCEWCI